MLKSNWLLLVCSLLALWLPKVECDEVINYMTICGGWLPDEACDFDDPHNSTKVYGIEINLIKKIYERIGWVEGTNFYYDCIDWDSIWDNLYYNDEALWSTTFTVNTERLSSGIFFTQVFFKFNQ